LPGFRPGTIHLAQGMPHRVSISTANFPRISIPVCVPDNVKALSEEYRDTLKRLRMALIEATHFYKTRKEEKQKNLREVFASEQ
jgi:hypothetical protein